MTLLDYIYLITLCFAILIGFWRGLVRQIFILVGVFIVSVGTSYVSPLPARWLEGAIQSDGTRNIVAVAITFVVLLVVYGIVARLVSRCINRTPVLGTVNRALGAAFGFLIVYLAFGFIVALVVQTSENFLAGLKQPFYDSWIVTNIYGGAESPERNFFGNWLLKVMLEKINALAPGLSQPEETAKIILKLV